MTVHESSISNDDTPRDEPLELLADDDEQMWTAVPVGATGDERITQWISVDRDVLCELAAWR